MNKTAGIGDWKLPSIRENYKLMMAQNPVHFQLAHGAMLGALGYYGMPWLASKIFPKKDIDLDRAKKVGLVGGALLPSLVTLPWMKYRMDRGYSLPEAALSPLSSLSKSSEMASFGELSSLQPPHMFGPIVSEDSINIWTKPVIGMNTAMATIDADPAMSEGQRLQAKATIQLAAREARIPSSGGLFSTADLVTAALGGGVGYMAGVVGGKALGALFGLAPSVQRRLAQVGTVAGIARATGIWQ